MTGQCSGDRESELSYSGTPSEYTLCDRLLEGGRRFRFCIRISCNENVSKFFLYGRMIFTFLTFKVMTPPSNQFQK